jgi:hypothetical protein
VPTINDPEIRAFLLEGTRTGELVVRLRPSKVLAEFNETG